eukprot:GHVR01080071.1.p1 GENE.GHVR01080071.1~~GHVR01080071.1.p1  ORF type:complete len:101 (-),score=4.16 GHVR01080071.1:2300-2602(-)
MLLLSSSSILVATILTTTILVATILTTTILVATTTATILVATTTATILGIMLSEWFSLKLIKELKAYTAKDYKESHNLISIQIMLISNNTKQNSDNFSSR